MRSMTKKSSTPKPSCSSSTSEAARNRGRKESSSKARDDRDSSSSRRDGGGGEAQELKKGPWTAEEDELLIKYIKTQGEGGWRTLPKRAGLLRCGKSCRLRWMNYLRPNVKRGHISPDEEDLILRLHRLLGNRWSLIAGRIPGRTDNEIKNYWNTHLSKKLIRQGIDPRTHKPFSNSDAIPSNQIKVNNQNSENLQAAPNTNPNSTTTATGSQSTSSSNRRAHHHHHPAASQSHVSLPTVEQKNSNSMMKEDLIRGHEQNVTQEENQFRSLKIGNNLIWNTTTTTTTSTAPAAACTSYQAGATTSVPITSGLGSESFNINQLMCPNSGNSTVTSNGLQQLLHHHFNDDDIMHGSNGDGDDDVFSSFLNSLINDDMIFPCNTGDDSVVIPQQIHGNQPHHQQLGLVPGTLPAPGGGGGGVLGRERGEDSHAVIMNISASSSMGFQMMGSQWDDPFQS